MTHWSELGLAVPALALDAMRESDSYEAFVQMARRRLTRTDTCSICDGGLLDSQLAICPPCWLHAKDGKVEPSAA